MLDRAETRRRIEIALLEPAGRAAREDYCRLVCEAFALTGERVYLLAWYARDDGGRALATVAKIAGELVGGAVAAMDAGHTYAGAALARQLVEVEYLAALFADDPDEPARWVTASTSQLRTHYSPAKLRERSGGRFTASAYRHHCGAGGHPSPDARQLLSGTTAPVADGLLQWTDLAGHAAPAWRDLLRSIDGSRWEGCATVELRHEVEVARAAWAERDLSARPWPSIPPPDDFLAEVA